MSVNIINGDMVKHLCSADHFDAYAHQCNCFGNMGKGIAPQLAKVVSGLLSVDKQSGIGNKNKLGTFTFAKHQNGSVVYNVYGQYNYGRGKQTINSELRKGLVAVRQHMIDNNLKTLGLPFIGCGLAGGDWEGFVYPTIKAIFEDNSVDVTIFKY